MGHYHRYALKIEYCGSYYHGWQRQEGLWTVQGCLEEALYALTGEKPETFGAGRTDAGVHAGGQVVHVDLKKSWDPYVLEKGLNHFLNIHHKKSLEYFFGHSKDSQSSFGKNSQKKINISFLDQFSPGIVVLKAKEAPRDFHGRFHGTWRRYSYKILNGYNSRVFFPQHWLISRPLDGDLLHKGCEIFLGHHNFSFFRHKDCQSKNPWKTIDKCFVEIFSPENSPKGREIYVHIQAKSFLHRQVRMMVGALVHVALHKWTLGDLLDVLNLEKPYEGPRIAPPNGLCLEEVFYSNFSFS